VTGPGYVAVELVRRGPTDILVAFLASSQTQPVASKEDDGSLEYALVQNVVATKGALVNLLTELQALLPAYMVPTILLPQST
jgi:hypothetical protein